MLAERGLLVTISVPGGDAVAGQTMNPKLGIVGGISILGTSGIVKPFSTSAYRASIYTELKMAVHNGVDYAVLATGKRSADYAQSYYPNLPDYAFVQVGDHIDYGLKQMQRLGFLKVTLSSMVGKISKLAQGRIVDAVEKILEAIELLYAAEAGDPSLDLALIKGLLNMTAKSVTVRYVTEAEALATKPTDWAMIQQAHAFIIDGDGFSAVGDHAVAVGRYLKAARRVEGIHTP